jgi:hypothetical protein
VDLAAASTPHVLETTPSTFGVLDGDSDPVENDPIFASAIVGCADLTAPFVCPIAGVGTVTMESNGRFSFLPEPGDTGTSESFQYTHSDGQATVNATVTLNRFERVWYVRNNAAAGGLGRSLDPFDTLAEAQTASLANNYIIVYFGNGTATGQAAGIALKSGQHLIGEHAGLSLPLNLNGNGSPTTLVAAAPGNRPLLDDTATGGAEGVSATDVIPIEIVGLNLAGNVNAIDWTTGAFGGSGSLSIRDNVIRSAGAEGVDLNLAGTSGLNLAFHDNNLTATGAALDIQETGTGSLTITTFDDNLVSGNTARFDATPGNPFNTVSGGTTAIGASGNGVGGAGMLLTNVIGDLSFTDLDIIADNGAGLQASSSGTFNAAAGTGFQIVVGAGVGIVEATNGPAVSITAATINLPLTSLRSTNSGTTGVALTNVAGTFSAGSGSTITNATGTDFSIDGGNANVTYNGTITDDVGQLVSVANTTGRTKTFTGAISDDNDGDGSGISLTSNTGATISFSGGIVLSTGTNAAFTATGGGTVNATGGTNTLATTTGMALNVTNTTIGASGLTFCSIATNGAASGMVLNNTGSSGGLTVTGDGVNTTLGGNGSGGTIQNTSGVGIVLQDTANVSLNYMNITNSATDGITINNINGFTFNRSKITDSTGVAQDRGIEIGNFSTGTTVNGTINITNSIIGPSSGNAPHDNVAAGVGSGTSIWNVTGNDLSNSGNAGFNFEFRNAAVISDMIISNNTFHANNINTAEGIHIQPAGGTTGSLKAKIENNNFANNNIAIDVNGDASATTTYNILTNTIINDWRNDPAPAAGSDMSSHAINVFMATTSTSAALMNVRLEDNIIGDANIELTAQVRRSVTACASTSTVTAMASFCSTTA